MIWRLDHFLVHGAFGLALVGFVSLLKTLGGPGGYQCFLPLLFPAGAWFISWKLPRGAPGASLCVAIISVLTFPSTAGPTAKTLTRAFSVYIAVSMLVCEMVAALVRLAQLRKSSGIDQNGA